MGVLGVELTDIAGVQVLRWTPKEGVMMWCEAGEDCGTLAAAVVCSVLEWTCHTKP